jgi:hypothetical protein
MLIKYVFSISRVGGCPVPRRGRAQAREGGRPGGQKQGINHSCRVPAGMGPLLPVHIRMAERMNRRPTRVQTTRHHSQRVPPLLPHNRRLRVCAYPDHDLDRRPAPSGLDPRPALCTVSLIAMHGISGSIVLFPCLFHLFRLSPLLWRQL